jgi:hypothetical protein
VVFGWIFFLFITVITVQPIKSKGQFVPVKVMTVYRISVALAVILSSGYRRMLRLTYRPCSLGERIPGGH